MKFILQILLILFLCFQVMADELVVGQNTLVRTGENMYEIVITCTGKVSDGSIEDVTINPSYLAERGLYLYRVIVENVSTDADVTDNSDVYLYESEDTGKSNDLLGGLGVNALDDNTRNRIELTEYENITGPLLLDVNSQSCVSGKYTITFQFVN